jgi:hypothetical protein
MSLATAQRFGRFGATLILRSDVSGDHKQA